MSRAGRGTLTFRAGGIILGTQVDAFVFIVKVQQEGGRGVHAHLPSGKDLERAASLSFPSDWHLVPWAHLAARKDGHVVDIKLVDILS